LKSVETPGDFLWETGGEAGGKESVEFSTPASIGLSTAFQQPFQGKC
jgi:hypothetical protein